MQQLKVKKSSEKAKSELNVKSEFNVTWSNKKMHTIKHLITKTNHAH